MIALQPTSDGSQVQSVTCPKCGRALADAGTVAIRWRGMRVRPLSAALIEIECPGRKDRPCTGKVVVRANGY